MTHNLGKIKMITIDDILATALSLLIEPRLHQILKLFPRSSLYRWLQNGKIPAIKRKNRWLTTEAAVQEFLRSRSVKPTICWSEDTSKFWLYFGPPVKRLFWWLFDRWNVF